MAGLTKEWLKLNIETLELEYSDLKPSAKKELAAYKIALAAMESAPIYEYMPDSGWVECSKELYEQFKEMGHRVRIVYAAPPAHAPDAVRPPPPPPIPQRSACDHEVNGKLDRCIRCGKPYSEIRR